MTAIGITLGSWLVSIAVHAVVTRFLGRVHRLTGYLVGAALVGACLTAWLLYRVGPTLDLLAILIVYVFLVEFYLFLITLTNSVAMRILLLLKGGPMPEDTILDSYPARSIFDKRLEEMERHGLLRQDGGCYSLCASGHRLARLFTLLQQVTGRAADD
jgi:hypothetical protein